VQDQTEELNIGMLSPESKPQELPVLWKDGKMDRWIKYTPKTWAPETQTVFDNPILSSAGLNEKYLAVASTL